MVVVEEEEEEGEDDEEEEGEDEEKRRLCGLLGVLPGPILANTNARAKV